MSCFVCGKPTTIIKKEHALHGEVNLCNACDIGLNEAILKFLKIGSFNIKRLMYYYVRKHHDPPRQKN